MMKKIAILVPDLCLGGGQRVALNTAQLLAQKHDVNLVIFTDEDTLFKTNIKVINLNCSKKHTLFGKFYNIYNRVKKYKRLLRKEKYDVTISFLESANLCAFLSHRQKSILTIHTSPELLTKFDQIILHYLFKYSHHLIAVSNGLKNTLETLFKLDNITVINNSIDPKLINSLANQNQFKHPRKFIVSVGRLVDEKRYDVMINAFYKTKASKEYDLIIIGDGPNFEKLKSNLDMRSNNVFLMGKMENPFPVIKEAELFLMTSRIEAFPMVLLEALSLSKPVVAYNCPMGLKDIVNHNGNGLLIKNNNLNGLVNAVDKVIYDKDLKESLIKNSQSSVNRYVPQVIAEDWEAYLRRF